MSNLAESLIKITSLKRKVQVDVSIITKGDGFLWTKRKQFFEDELNPQFLQKTLTQSL